MQNTCAPCRNTYLTLEYSTFLQRNFFDCGRHAPDDAANFIRFVCCLFQRTDPLGDSGNLRVEERGQLGTPHPSGRCYIPLSKKEMTQLPTVAVPN